MKDRRGEREKKKICLTIKYKLHEVEERVNEFKKYFEF